MLMQTLLKASARLMVGLVLLSSTVWAAAPLQTPQLLTDEEKAVLSNRPELMKVLLSGRDVWGEAAMRLPNGPNYNYFAKLLPPLEYVNAAFKYYPIVLSAPGAVHKARLISNGSAVNARAELKTWREVGFPVTFKVGDSVFGEDLRKLDGPHYAKRYLPVVSMSYSNNGSVYSEEAFASTDSELAQHAGVYVKFSLKSGASGTICAQVGGTTPLREEQGALIDAQGGVLVRLGPGWKWDAAKRELTASLQPQGFAVLVIFTSPVPAPVPALDYDAQRARCIQTWEALVARSMQVETPEAVVNDAWKSLIVGNFMLLKDDNIVYSAGNQYEKLYINEGGDTAKSFLLWGYADEARRMIVPLMDYQRPGLLFHQAGLKLQLLSKYYWMTRDKQFFNDQRVRWMLQANRIIDGREKEIGLFPREQYCGDITQPVYSLNSNSNSWRGLRDFGAALGDMGESELSSRMLGVAGEFRPCILSAVHKSVRKDVKPPFVPIALFGDEQPYEALTASRLGGYWDLMAPLVLGSGVLGDESEQTGWILDYFQQRGGICMGMVRVHPAGPMYTVKQGVDDLYSLRYVLTLLRRDEVDRALVTFYGKLAQGFTRETFIDGESSGLVPFDEFGRPMYLPPNSAANALFLWMLRYLMVQDWDVNDDGRPDTLRLMFATPKSWLADGKSIKVNGAPTEFGKVSIVVSSHLKKGEVTAEVSAPPRTPSKMLLRIRLPDGWRAASASVGKKKLAVDSKGTSDISGMTGKFTVRFAVNKMR